MENNKEYKAAWLPNPAGGSKWGFMCTKCGSIANWKLPDRCPTCKTLMHPLETTHSIEGSNKVLIVYIWGLYNLPYKIYDSRITDKFTLEPDSLSSLISSGPGAKLDKSVMRSQWVIDCQDGYLEISGDIDGVTDMEFWICEQ